MLATSDIPLTEQQVTAEGDVRCVQQFVYCHNSTLKNLNGKFSFVNGAKSGPLTATGFNQPLETPRILKYDGRPIRSPLNLNGNLAANAYMSLPP